MQRRVNPPYPFNDKLTILCALLAASHQHFNVLKMIISRPDLYNPGSHMFQGWNESSFGGGAAKSILSDFAKLFI
jgi:hypothetical protein